MLFEVPIIHNSNHEFSPINSNNKCPWLTGQGHLDLSLDIYLYTFSNSSQKGETSGRPPASVTV